MAYNISEVGGDFVGTGTLGLDDWTVEADLSDPSVTVVTGDFDQVPVGSGNEGEAPDGYVFSALSTTDYGSLTYNTVDGTFTFTINRSAVISSGSDQTVTFTVTGTDGPDSDEDTVIINLLVCVGRGTRIRTDQGRIPVEDIAVGDNVWTMDDGYQKVRWIGSRAIGREELDVDSSLKPIRIEAGALGSNIPQRTFRVSPQHRILLRDWRAQILFGQDEVLIAAKCLVNDWSVSIDSGTGGVEYFHLMFDSHQIIETDGALTESFYPGDYSLRAIDGPARRELFRIFPQLKNGFGAYGPAARASLTPGEARCLGELDFDGGVCQ